MVLLDEEKQARGTKDDLVKSKLIREENVVFISEAAEAGKINASTRAAIPGLAWFTYFIGGTSKRRLIRDRWRASLH